MTVQKKQRRIVVLKDLHTAIEWQCAHTMVQHAEPGKRIKINFETPDGTITLAVQPVGKNQLIVTRAEDTL